MLTVSICCYTADIYTIIHFIPHACHHITVDARRVSLSIGVRIIMSRYVVYLLRIF
jgi:hypothetical protein